MNVLFRSVKGMASALARRPGLIVAVVSTALSIGLAEFVCWRINVVRSRETVYSSSYAGFFPRDETLGYKPPSNAVANIALRKRGRLVYDVVYSIDALSRRVVPQSASDGRTRHAVFFGCSNTFGDGLNDGETIPAQFAKRLDSFKVYNYAYSGYGPQHALAHLQRDAFCREVAETNGVAFYIYLPEGHEKRVIGALSVFNSWGKHLPCYRFDKTGCLERVGDFASARPWINRFYRGLGYSQILKISGIDVPLVLTESHYRLTAAVLAEAAGLYERKFPGSRFYVVLFPTRVKDLRILPFLKERGVRCLDYARLFDPLAPAYRIEGDGHPSAYACEVLARRLAADMAKPGEGASKGQGL